MSVILKPRPGKNKVIQKTKLNNETKTFSNVLSYFLKPLDRGRTLNVHKTFKGCSERSFMPCVRKEQILFISLLSRQEKNAHCHDTVKIYLLESYASKYPVVMYNHLKQQLKHQSWVFVFCEYHQDEKVYLCFNRVF